MYIHKICLALNRFNFVEALWREKSRKIQKNCSTCLKLIRKFPKKCIENKIDKLEKN